jgi:hypothetical protein
MARSTDYPRQRVVRLALGVSLLALGAIALAGCGGSSRAPTTATPAAIATATSTRLPASPTNSATSSQATSMTITATNVVGDGNSVTFTCDALADGATLALPASLTCHVSGLDAAEMAQLRAQVTVEGVVPAIVLELEFDSSGQTLTLPDDKRLTGLRTLRFELAGPDGQPITDPGASFTVRDVTLTGSR